MSLNSASQSAPCFIPPHCFLFLFDWHTILKRCLHHWGALDWTRLLDPTLTRLKRDSRLGSALFIDSKTCSHSGGPFLFLFCIIPDQDSTSSLRFVLMSNLNIFWGSASPFHMLGKNSNRCVSDELHLTVFCWKCSFFCSSFLLWSLFFKWHLNLALPALIN